MKHVIWKMISAAALIALLAGCPTERRLSGENRIISFILAGVTGTIDQEANTISVTVPHGTDLTSLTPEITVPAGASCSPTGEQNFTAPVIYTVTAENGDARSYTVNVTVEGQPRITAFILAGAAGVIDQGAKTISVTVPYGTNLTSLEPVIEGEGYVSYSPVGPQNFTSPVAYTVTGPGGAGITYTVTASAAGAGVKNITAFTLAGAAGVIDQANRVISVSITGNVDVSSALPYITWEGASISPTGPQNFTSPVVYTVTAGDNTTISYTVTVTVTVRHGKAITGFTLAGAAGIISEVNHTVSVTLPQGVSLSGLTPVVTVSAGASYSPTGPQNFAVPVVYTVTAEDGLSQQYTVTVNTANYTYSREYWGEWVRIDTGDTWYINSGAIKINGGAASGYTFAPKALTDKVISVNNGAFYLYASRAATATFTGKITIDLPSAQRSVSRAIGAGLGGIKPPVITLKEDPAVVIPVVTDPGEYEEGDWAALIEPVSGAENEYTITLPGIPEDEITVTIPGPTEEEIAAGLYRDYDPGIYDILPGFGDSDVGNMRVTKGQNLKASVRLRDSSQDMTALYASGEPYQFVLEISNVTDSPVSGVSCTLSLDAGLSFGSSQDFQSGTQVLGGFAAHQTKEYGVTVMCDQFSSGDFVDRKVNLTFTSLSTEGTIHWNDAVSLRFNRGTTYFDILSKGVDPGSGPVHGVITTPKGKSYQFTTQPYAGDLYRATVTVPWSAEPYLAALIGADINKEAFYSLGFGEAADTVMSLENLQNYGGGGLLNYEPNDTEAAATVIDDGGRVVSYLTSLYPYDYYRVSLAGKQPVYDRLFIRSAQPVEYTGSNNDGNLNPGDTVALDLLLYNNYSSPVSADLTLTATGNKSAYITIEKGTAQVSGISSKYYATLTSYQSSAEDGVSFFSGYHPQNYFRFKVDENCPLGDLTFQVGFAAPGLTWYKDLTFQVLDRNRDIAAGTHTLVDTVSGDVNNRDGSANAGEGFGITIPVSNTGNAAVSGLQAALSSTSAYAVIDQSIVNIGTLSAGGAVTAAFHFTIDAQCRDSVLPFRITFTDNGSLGYTRTWWNTFSIPVAADPNIVINIDSHAIGYKTGGDDDGKIEAGETYYLDIKVVNAGTKMVNSLQAALSTASPLVSIMKGESAFLGASLNLNQYMSLTSTGASSNTNSIGLLQSARIDNAFVFAIAKNYPVGTDIVFTVSITYSGGFVDQTIRVPVAAPEKEDEGITVIGGADVDNQIVVNLSTTAPLSKSAGNSVTFTLTNTAQYQGWQWKRDGENAGTGPTLTLYANSLSVGTHYVSLIIRKDGLWYSKEYQIRVVN